MCPEWAIGLDWSCCPSTVPSSFAILIIRPSTHFTQEKFSRFYTRGSQVQRSGRTLIQVITEWTKFALRISIRITTSMHVQRRTLSPFRNSPWQIPPYVCIYSVLHRNFIAQILHFQIHSFDSIRRSDNWIIISTGISNIFIQSQPFRDCQAGHESSGSSSRC